MITSLLIFTIGLLPLVLAVNVTRIYKGSQLGIALLLFMCSVTLWQMDIGVLYLKGIIPEEWILNLFRFFRIGTTGVVPVIFYLIYLLLNKHTPNIKNKTGYNFFQSFFKLKIFWGLVVWSVGIYAINWTKWGIEGLRVVQIADPNTSLYFPDYGDYHFLYLLHTGTVLLLLIIVVIICRGIQNASLKAFLRTFSYCSMFLLLTGFLNFIPGTGAVISSIGVIIFSSSIIFSFVKMNNIVSINYNLLQERQKKLDYMGNLSTSLIHEVKNNIQIIKGYSKMVAETAGLPKQSEHHVGMIQLGTSQLEELTHHYSEYIKKKAVEFNDADLNQIIQEAIDFTAELRKEKQIDICFEQKYKPLKAFASSTYLKQVFINLIKNSCEAIDDVNPKRNIAIKTDIVADKIIIDISDSGIGIVKDRWESIFDPFISTKELGMGIGLPFVRKVIFEHRGEIFVLESSQNGTTFRVRLPQYEFSELSHT
ncbi:HAMP domain-containing sensor histidine kinase [Bacillus sp. J37]|uniref:sensor histidine kinase n=1 Tax=Bacillus sp. J37 TaxID=935837 RepID=UPI00047E6075|nr:HAMP domain-containing sensor histidine kinase [Bacillus sp. J37]